MIKTKLQIIEDIPIENELEVGINLIYLFNYQFSSIYMRNFMYSGDIKQNSFSNEKLLFINEMVS